MHSSGIDGPSPALPSRHPDPTQPAPQGKQQLPEPLYYSTQIHTFQLQRQFPGAAHSGDLAHHQPYRRAIPTPLSPPPRIATKAAIYILLHIIRCHKRGPYKSEIQRNLSYIKLSLIRRINLLPFPTLSKTLKIACISYYRGRQLKAVTYHSYSSYPPAFSIPLNTIPAATPNHQGT